MLIPLAAVTPVPRLAPGEAEPERRHGADRRGSSAETSRARVYERGPDGEFYAVAERAAPVRGTALQGPAIPPSLALGPGTWSPITHPGAGVYAAVEGLGSAASPLGGRLDVYA